MFKPKKYRLAELADFLNANLLGDEDFLVTGIAPLSKAKKSEISFLKNHKNFMATEASAIIIRAQDVSLFANNSVNFLIVNDPYLAYAKISSLFDNAPLQTDGIHDTVIIGNDCNIDSTAKIAANCVIGNGVKIAERVTIGAGCVIGDNVTIASGSHLYPNVTMYHNIRIGKNVIIHSGTVIGADGFGNANENGVWHKIYQLGGVFIGDNVEIGANTTIDRGALEDTVIEEGVKIDNQVQIGHNVHVGCHTAIAGCCGIAGSVKIGKHCIIAGKVGIGDHLELTDGVIVTAASSVAKSISEPGIYASALPVLPQRSWWRIVARLLKIDDLDKRLQKIEAFFKGEKSNDKI